MNADEAGNILKVFLTSKTFWPCLWNPSDGPPLDLTLLTLTIIPTQVKVDSKSKNINYLVEFVSLGADVVHEDLVRSELELYRGPGVLSLLQPHPAPQLVNHLDPKTGLRKEKWEKNTLVNAIFSKKRSVAKSITLGWCIIARRIGSRAKLFLMLKGYTGSFILKVRK